MLREKPMFTVPGTIALLLILAAFAGSAAWITHLARVDEPGRLWQPLAVVLLAALSIGGLFIVNPNDGQAVLLFGRYLGTVKTPGFHWVSPFTTRTRVSLRVRNFESSKLKVNDLDGNPIEIAVVVVWQVVDTAEALFQVNDYEDFVHIQSELALC